MTIETKHDIGSTITVEIDGSPTLGVVEGIGIRVNKDGSHRIVYEGTATYKVKNQQFTRQFIEPEVKND